MMDNHQKSPWKCINCEQILIPVIYAGPEWRWNGRSWEHKCPNNNPEDRHYRTTLVQMDRR